METALTEDRSFQITDMAGSAFGRIYKNLGNSMIPLTVIQQDYHGETRVTDMMLRTPID